MNGAMCGQHKHRSCRCSPAASAMPPHIPSMPLMPPPCSTHHTTHLERGHGRRLRHRAALQPRQSILHGPHRHLCWRQAGVIGVGWKLARGVISWGAGEVIRLGWKLAGSPQGLQAGNGAASRPARRCCRRRCRVLQVADQAPCRQQTRGRGSACIGSRSQACPRSSRPDSQQQQLRVGAQLEAQQLLPTVPVRPALPRQSSD